MSDAVGVSPLHVPTLGLTRAEARYRFVGALHAHVGTREHGKDNYGEMVALYLKSVGLPEGYPWCAALQYYVGHGALRSADGKHSAWPLPATGSCMELGAFAEKHGILYDTPEVGDLMLFWEYVASEKRARWAHVEGVIEVVSEQVVHTVGGNTNDDGGRNGWGTLYKTRTYGGHSGYGFVRWLSLFPE